VVQALLLHLAFQLMIGSELRAGRFKQENLGNGLVCQAAELGPVVQMPKAGCSIYGKPGGVDFVRARRLGSTVGTEVRCPLPRTGGCQDRTLQLGRQHLGSSNRILLQASAPPWSGVHTSDNGFWHRNYLDFARTADCGVAGSSIQRAGAR
jgi:hypothetical protein